MVYHIPAQIRCRQPQRVFRLLRLMQVLKEMQLSRCEDILRICEGSVLTRRVLQTYTVEFSRDGSPQKGFVVGRLKSNGHRFLANNADDATLKQLCSHDVEPIGRTGKVKPSQDGRNVFSFVGETARL
jgi:hypothetical protein